MKTNEINNASLSAENDLSAAAPAQSETHAPDLGASAAALGSAVCNGSEKQNSELEKA